MQIIIFKFYEVWAYLLLRVGVASVAEISKCFRAMKTVEMLNCYKWTCLHYSSQLNMNFNSSLHTIYCLCVFSFLFLSHFFLHLFLTFCTHPVYSIFPSCTSWHFLFHSCFSLYYTIFIIFPLSISSSSHSGWKYKNLPVQSAAEQTALCQQGYTTSPHQPPLLVRNTHYAFTFSCISLYVRVHMCFSLHVF